MDNINYLRRLRRMAKKQGMAIRKDRRTETYYLVDIVLNAVVCHSMHLEHIEGRILEEDQQNREAG